MKNSKKFFNYVYNNNTNDKTLLIRSDMKYVIDNFDYTFGLTRQEVYYAFKKLGLIKFIFFCITYYNFFLNKEDTSVFYKTVCENRQLSSEVFHLKKTLSSTEKLLNSEKNKKKKKKKNNKNRRRKHRDNVIKHNEVLSDSYLKASNLIKDTLSSCSDTVVKKSLKKVKKYLVKSSDNLKKSNSKKKKSIGFSLYKVESPSKIKRRNLRAEKFCVISFFLNRGSENKLLFREGKIELIVFDSRGFYKTKQSLDPDLYINFLKENVDVLKKDFAFDSFSSFKDYLYSK